MAAEVTAAKVVEAMALREPEQYQVKSAAVEKNNLVSASSLNNRRVASARSGQAATRRLEDTGQAWSQADLRRVFEPQNSSRSCVVARPPRLPRNALPNPSLKPSPNGKPPGRRYSAALLLLQRRPGVFPLVPA